MYYLFYMLHEKNKTDFGDINNRTLEQVLEISVISSNLHKALKEGLLKVTKTQS